MNQILLDILTPEISPMPWSELAALFAVAGGIGGAIIWILSMWLGQRYITRGECELRKQSLDLSKATALARLAQVEVEVKDHSGQLTRVEEHLRSVDQIAKIQADLAQEMALTKQPIQEFRSLVEELKNLFQTFISDIGEWRIEYERRLTVVETQFSQKSRKSGRVDPQSE